MGGNPDDAFICELDHHPGCGPRQGPLFPSICAHANMFSVKKQRIALPSELFLALGLDVFPAVSNNRGASPMLDPLRSLSIRQQKVLAGNSMHIPMMSYWILYVLSNCVRVDELSKMSKWTPPMAEGPGPGAASLDEATEQDGESKTY